MSTIEVSHGSVRAIYSFTWQVFIEHNYKSEKALFKRLWACIPAPPLMNYKHGDIFPRIPWYPSPRFIVRIKYIKHINLFLAFMVNTEQVLGIINIIFSGY